MDFKFRQLLIFSIDTIKMYIVQLRITSSQDHLREDNASDYVLNDNVEFNSVCIVVQ
jgi:hypothetical protein